MPAKGMVPSRRRKQRMILGLLILLVSFSIYATVAIESTYLQPIDVDTLNLDGKTMEEARQICKDVVKSHIDGDFASGYINMCNNFDNRTEMIGYIRSIPTK